MTQVLNALLISLLQWIVAMVESRYRLSQKRAAMFGASQLEGFRRWDALRTIVRRVMPDAVGRTVPVPVRVTPLQPSPKRRRRRSRR